MLNIKEDTMSEYCCYSVRVNIIHHSKFAIKHNELSFSSNNGLWLKLVKWQGSALTVSSHGSHHCGPHAHYPPRGAPQPCLVCTHARNKCDKCAQAATNQRGTPAGRERRAQSCVPRSCLPPSTWTHLTLDTGDQWGGGRVTRDQSEDSSAQWRHYKCPVLSLFSRASSASSALSLSSQQLTTN